MTELGSGIRLDGDFDMVVGDDGDADNNEGIGEVGKDMSLAVTEVLTTGRTDRLPDTYGNVQVPDSISPDFDPDTGELSGSGGVVGSFFDEGLLRDIEVLVANLIGVHDAVDVVTRVESQTADEVDRVSEDDPNTIVIDGSVLLIELETGTDFEFVITPS